MEMERGELADVEVSVCFEVDDRHGSDRYRGTGHLAPREAVSCSDDHCWGEDGAGALEQRVPPDLHQERPLRLRELRLTPGITVGLLGSGTSTAYRSIDVSELTQVLRWCVVTPWKIKQ